MLVGHEYLCKRHFKNATLGAEQLSEEEYAEERRARADDAVAQLSEMAARHGRRALGATGAREDHQR